MLLEEKSAIFFTFQTTEVRDVQPVNALFPIVVKLVGKMIEVRPVQPEKTLLPILVTLLGIVTEVRPVQS